MPGGRLFCSQIRLVISCHMLIVIPVSIDIEENIIFQMIVLVVAVSRCEQESVMVIGQLLYQTWQVL